MIRLIDILFSFLGLFILIPLLLFLYVLGLFDTGSPLFSQVRIGRDQVPFNLIKFRTMIKAAPSVATHLTDLNAVTRYGAILRKTKLDELPQLWNVLKGDMSLVGPRPNLFNQEDLINARGELGVYSVRPGITGLAQINHIDMSTPELLAKTDAEMILNMSLVNYFKYIFLTVVGKGRGDSLRR